ncbi:ArsR/SmtB family transcription factor [Alkalihalobacillus hemicellulosilyticus]|uniref:Cadmium efflux system accessory protein n=1 Tax=Halalkalibacter hemicellulosilyticusJCM 9152 TaxID=1236971 RepID=W4QIU5_9BACI|nr:metalloregulator ArsR/SmtB family transcription factor [Halalkalibacter hemicellulosilyticus]GAE31837.1 cadmium efflux system accessory protein [Halalkalibacter hemicellulosilyticusJCM 9152]
MADQCEIQSYDEAKVKRIKGLLVHKEIQAMSKMFKALSDDTRMKIAYALSEEEELCVCDVAQIIGSTTATASHHLRLLRNMGLAKYRKDGKWVFYSLDDDHIKQLIVMAYEHQKERRALR